MTPAPLPTAADLLSLLEMIGGRFVLSGQHNQPIHGSARTERIAALTGSTPAIWGGEIGFSAPGTLDGVDRRSATVAEAVRAHAGGAGVVITWHALCPLHDEPVPFEGGILRAFDPEDFDALRLLFSRLVDHHGLVNLLWPWNPNAPYCSADPIEDHYPGHDVLDLLGVDVYGSRYDQRFHDQLLRLAGGRPIGLGEVGGLPGPGVLDAQPRWCWYMAWPGQVLSEPDGLGATTADPRVLGRDGLGHLRRTAAFVPSMRSPPIDTRHRPAGKRTGESTE